MTMTSVERHITKARIALLTDHPFFGSLAMRLRMVEDASIPTMATNGKDIRYNPEFTMNLPIDEVKGVLAHEVMHCALAHHARRGERNPENWNIAADYAINPLLIGAGLKLPSSALVNSQYAGLSAEEIYTRLPPPPPGGGGGFGAVEDGTDDNGQQASPAELEQQAQTWKIAAQAVEAACKRQGTMPAGVDRALDNAKAQTVDWRSVLRRFVVQSLSADSTWARPNRRFVGQGLYLPGIKREAMGGFVVWIDTSGSVGGQELADFTGEVTSLVAECSPAYVVVGYADAAVHNVERFDKGEPLVFKPAGGGGTDFRPAFNWVADQDERPAGIIYLTDMMGTFPAEAPDTPTLWVTNSHVDTAPFGEVVRMLP